MLLPIDQTLDWPSTTSDVWSEWISPPDSDHISRDIRHYCTFFWSLYNENDKINEIYIRLIVDWLLLLFFSEISRAIVGVYAWKFIWMSLNGIWIENLHEWKNRKVPLLSKWLSLSALIYLPALLYKSQWFEPNRWCPHRNNRVRRSTGPWKYPVPELD